MSSNKNGWIQCVGIKVLLTHFFVIEVGLTSFGRVYRTQNEMMICSSIHNFLTTLLLLWKALLVGYMSTKKLSWLNKQLGHHLSCTFRLSCPLSSMSANIWTYLRIESKRLDANQESTWLKIFQSKSGQKFWENLEDPLGSIRIH